MEELVGNRYVQAAAIAAAFIILAKVADYILSRQIVRWTRRTNTRFDDRFIALLHRPVFITLVVVGLALATLKMRLPLDATWVTLGALQTLAVLVWMYFGFSLANLIRDQFVEAGDKSPLPDRTLPLFNNLAKVVFVLLAGYFIFLTWEIDVTAWLASAGIIGIALGFAAKDTLANLFSGVFILVDAPYKVGDFIILGTGERGLVTHIGIRSTRILTRDDIEITIPNAVIGAAQIVNESGGPHEKRRLRVNLQVAYGTDIDRLREVLLDIAAEHPGVCDDPEPRVRFRSFGDSGLTFELLAWVEEPVLKGRTMDAINSTVYKRLMAEKIVIPYPVRDVRLHRVDD